MTQNNLFHIQVVAISGGSGSGKTYAAKRLQALLGGEEYCRILSQDHYYRDQSQCFRGDGSVNYDHPHAIDFPLMAEHLRLICQGQTVEIPKYNFSTHTRSLQTQTFTPSPIVVMDGILLLAQDLLRPFFKISVFLDVSQDTRFQRRLTRDVKERGRTPDGVRVQFFSLVKPMHDQYVQPSRQHAQHVYTEGESLDLLLSRVCQDLGYAPRVSAETSQEQPRRVISDVPCLQQDKTAYIEHLFDKIAPRYDFLNRLLSFRQDVRWRNELLNQLPITPMPFVEWDICDLACGTGDVIFDAIKRFPQYRKLIGIDLSSGMLRQAIVRSRRYSLDIQNKIQFFHTNAENLPLKDQSCAAVTMSFGLRNVADRHRALTEMHRVLAQGGVLCILEFFPGKTSLFFKAFDLYFKKVLPRIAGLFSWKEAYHYLPNSVASMPSGEVFLKTLEQIGFVKVRLVRCWLWGGVRLYVGYKQKGNDR